MTAPHLPMKSLYQKLNLVGYKPGFVRSLLPAWWDDAIAETPAGFQQASLILGRLFSVQPETLWAEQIQPVLVVPNGRKFKQRVGTESHELDVACALARSAARLTLKSFKPAYRGGFHTDAAELRQKLLIEKKWIEFKDLLAYCLEVGIPVIFLKHFPPKTKKMAGVSFEHEGRPVIVLTQNKAYGHLLFDLAHELGHITLGHTQGGAWVIDAKIDVESDDEEERAANRFALELLTGNPECKIVPTGRHLNAQELENAASRYGEAHKIDPLHIILNYGHTHNRWPVATNAVNLFAQNRETDQKLLIKLLLASLDVDAIKEDDLAALECLMGEDAGDCPS
jgi:hypothetical protein